MKLSPCISLLLSLASACGAFTILPSNSKSMRNLKITMSNNNEINSVERRDLFQKSVSFAAGTFAVSQMFPQASNARLDPVNRPDLLPSESGQNVIQTEKMLTSGQVKRMEAQLASLEKDTGFRVRVLCQAYPNTPGLAIRDYWSLGKEDQIDDKYVVLVVDQFGGKGNALNFNVGDGVKFALPNVFWTRLQSKYGSVSFFFHSYNFVKVFLLSVSSVFYTTSY